MKKIKYINSELNKALKSISIHKESLKDKFFKKDWKHERAKRLLKIKNCKYCRIIFTKKNPAVLHHQKMPSKEKELEEKKVSLGIEVLNEKLDLKEASKKYQTFIEELINYYKTLNDTDLICVSCHAKEHLKTIKRSIQRTI